VTQITQMEMVARSYYCSGSRKSLQIRPELKAELLAVEKLGFAVLEDLDLISPFSEQVVSVWFIFAFHCSFSS
jgi:hypothetical protein